jgi:PAS domain S-box-containing protein
MKSPRWLSLNLPRQPAHAVWLLAALVIALILFFVTALLWNLRARELDHDRQQTLAVTHLFVDQTERSIERTDLILQSILDRLKNSSGYAWSSPEVQLMMVARSLGVRLLSDVFIADIHGRILNSTTGRSGFKSTVAQEDFFKTPATTQDNLYISQPYRLPKSPKQWALFFSRPILDETGHRLGVIVAVAEIANLESSFHLLQPDYVRPITLYRHEDGVLLASYPHLESLEGSITPWLAAQDIPDSGNGVKFLRQAGFIEEEKMAIASLAKYPLAVGVETNSVEALARWREMSVPIAIATLMLAGFIAYSARLVGRRVTQQVRLAGALEEANERYTLTVESLMDAIVAVDESHHIVLFNQAAAKMFGYAAQEMIGQPLNRLIPARFIAGHKGHMDRFGASGKSRLSQGAIFGLRSDGTEFPIESAVSRALVEGKLQLTAVLRDITERRRAEAELKDLNQQLRGLSTTLHKVREQERHEMARELHDDLGQQLTAIKLDLTWLQSRLREGREVEPEKLTQIRALVDNAIGTVRRMSTELRPLVLDLGFGEAVNWLVGQYRERTALKIDLNLEMASWIRGSEFATALYRVVQESLNNITRHSGATWAAVQLEREDGHLVLEVVDNGKGMPEQIRVGAFGLVSMRERAMAFGGEFSITSDTGQGTRIRVRFPLHLPIFQEDLA